MMTMIMQSVIDRINSYDVALAQRIRSISIKRANSGKITTFKGCPFLTPACADLFEPRGSVLGLQKSTLNAENFVYRLSLSISSHFGAIDS